MYTSDITVGDDTDGIRPVNTQRRYSRGMNDWKSRVRALLQKKSISQAKLIPVLGVGSRGAVSHYLTGRNPISLEQFLALAKFLNVTPEYLISGESGMQVRESIRDYQSQQIKIDAEKMVEAVDILRLAIRLTQSNPDSKLFAQSLVFIYEALVNDCWSKEKSILRLVESLTVSKGNGQE